MSPDRQTLFVLLQSALIQDLDATSSATIRHTRKNTRLLAYNLRGKEPTLVGEYVVQLPQFPDPASTTGQTLTAAQSELHALSDTQFLVLARDSGNGFSSSTSTSAYRSVDLIDISQATNLAETKFDSPANPIAPNGVLDATITPALYQKFLDINDNTQLTVSIFATATRTTPTTSMKSGRASRSRTRARTVWGKSVSSQAVPTPAGACGRQTGSG
jgi:hypothetical protein